MRSSKEYTESGPLRVLMVAARYFPYMGGVETHVYEVGKRLARADVEVTVLTTDVSGQLPVVEDLEGVHILRVRAWPSNKDYYFAPGIYRAITGGKWDLVHCQGYHNLVAPISMLAARRAKIPYVVTFHSGGDANRLRTAFRGAQRMALRPLLAQAEQLISPSKWELEFFRERLHLPGRQFVVIPNGAHHLARPAVLPCGSNDGPLILSIGRLERYKGHQRLIAAMPKLLEQVPDARLRIVGVGPYEPVLRKLVRQLGVAESVEIRPIPPGDHGGMASLIARANVVVLLSEHEAQGIAVLEALALGRPVLVARTTALQEFAERGLARAVSLKSTPEEVATAVIDQLRQPLVPPKVELPTWDDCATALLSVYQVVTRRVPCVS